MQSALPAHFNLTRWFALLALLAIASIATAAGVLLSRFVAERMLAQEARLANEFVGSLMEVDKSLQSFFANPTQGMDAKSERAMRHIAAMPDVLRTNVYDARRKIIWSSDPQLVGRAFDANDELDRALAGAVIMKESHDEEHTPAKAEHQHLKHPQPMYFEIYVPVFDAQGHKVLSVMEFYKNPRALGQALRQMRLYIAVGGVASSALLFLALYGLVRRAAQTIRSQQRQLVESETLAAIGEMSSAVAHGIRNPLASIRSSAELMQYDPQRAQEAASDIVAQSDRLESWVNQLLSYSRPLDAAPMPVLLPDLVAQCLQDLERDLQRRHIKSRTEWADGLPAVRGDALLLGQVLRIVLTNAMEALDHDGQIVVRGACGHNHDGVTLSIEDSGPGMTAAQLARVGKPFFTTKPRGLGIGLALARRVVERFGGRIDIQSQAGVGTVVQLHMQAA